MNRELAVYNSSQNFGERLQDLLRSIPLPGLQIQRYIAKEYFFYFNISFLFFLTIFFVNQILLLAREQLAELISVWDTLRLVLFAMPSIIALSVPYASFIGIILAVGKLSEEREIMAARASGVGYRILFTPIVISALILSSISFFVNDFLIPVSITNYTRLYQELLYSNSRLIIEPFSIRNFNGSIIVTGAVDEESINGITILDTTNSGTRRTINATRADIVRNDQQRGIITLSLTGAEIISTTDEITQISEADTMNYNILIEDINFSLSNPSVREMSARDVYSLILEQQGISQSEFATAQMNYERLQTQYLSRIASFAFESDYSSESYIYQNYTNLPLNPEVNFQDRTLRLYQLEFWKKFSVPLSSITFIFLGFPLGMIALRSGRTLSIVLGFTISSLYWALLTINELSGLNLVNIHPTIVVFFPNILMLISGFFLHRLYFRN